MLRVKSIKYSILFDTLKTCNCAQLLMACGSYTYTYTYTLILHSQFLISNQIFEQITEASDLGDGRLVKAKLSLTFRLLLISHPGKAQLLVTG